MAYYIMKKLLYPRKLVLRSVRIPNIAGNYSTKLFVRFYSWTELKLTNNQHEKIYLLLRNSAKDNEEICFSKYDTVIKERVCFLKTPKKLLICLKLSFN